MAAPPKIIYIILIGVFWYTGCHRTILKMLYIPAIGIEPEVQKVFVEPIPSPPEGFSSFLKNYLRLSSKIYEDAMRPIFNYVPMGRYLIQMALYICMMYSFAHNVRFFYESKYRCTVNRDSTSRLYSAHRKTARDYGDQLRAVKMYLDAYRKWYVFHMRECKSQDVSTRFFRVVADENDRRCQTLAHDELTVADKKPRVDKKRYSDMMKELKNLDRDMKAVNTKIEYFQGNLENLNKELDYQTNRFWPNEDGYYTTSALLPESFIEILNMMQSMTEKLKEYSFEDSEAYDGSSLDCPQNE